MGAGESRGTLFGRFTYDSLGRLRSAAYDVDSDDGDLENEDVDWYAYDDRWRLVAVHRQDFKYQQVKLRERFVYADRGIGAREGGGSGNKLDCPAYAEFDEDFDGIFERRITYVQDRGGNIVAVFDSSREQLDSPADTTPSQYPIRIAYTAFGEPINVGTAGLGTYESNGSVYDVLDLDFNNDRVIDASDLASLTDVIESEGSPTCETNGQACDHADFNRDGDVNADDLTAFTGAIAGTLGGTTTYSVHSRDIGDYRFLYRGYWYDRHLGIYHVRHRAYDPRIQRWLQPDPAMFVDGLNRYAYCGNRPFSAYDPMGLWFEQTATRIANSGFIGAEAVGTALGMFGAFHESGFDSVVAIVNPMTYVNTFENAIAREHAHAVRGGYEVTVIHLAIGIIGEFTGANELADAGIRGIDVIEGREVKGWERFERGVGGAVQMVGTAAGTSAGVIKVINLPISTRFSSWRARNDVHIGNGTGFWGDLKAKIRGETFVDGMDAADAARYSASQTAKSAPSVTHLDLVTSAARNAVRTVGPGRGPLYGIRVHTAFAAYLRTLPVQFSTEVSYLHGRIVRYGTPGAVRVDALVGSPLSPLEIYDLKTGSAALTPKRIHQIRLHLPAACRGVPIHEVRP